MSTMNAQDDVFACFGSESDSDSESESGAKSTSAASEDADDGLPIGDDDGDGDGNNAHHCRLQSQHLIDQANARIKRLELARHRRATAANVLPISGHENDYEVFEDTATTTTATATTATPPAPSSSPPAAGAQAQSAAAASRGKGVRAKRSYEAGDEILRESAVMRIPIRQAAATLDEAQSQHRSAVSDAFASLSPPSKRAVEDLSVCERWEHLDRSIGVFQTNSYELRGEADGGLFLTTARINHGCRPNANHVWRADLQQQAIFCCRPIEVGEEILVTYGPTFSQRLDTMGRREFLREKFSFECLCTMCSEGNGNGGDDRMRRIMVLRDDIVYKGTKSNSDETLRKVEDCILLLQEQGLGGGSFTLSLLRNAYENTQDASQARSYLERELDIVRDIEGIGCIREGEIRYQLSQLVG